MHWQTWFDTLNLLDAFNYYLILAFIVSVGINLRNYRTILGLILASSNRWPKLLELVKKHRTIFLGWPTLLVIGIAFALMVCNSLAIHYLWVQAEVTCAELWGHWLAFLAVLVLGGLMLFLDISAMFRGAALDRPALEKALDQAESWLKSWMAPAIAVLTLGFVNPRKIVGAEVQKLLVKANWIMIGGMGRASRCIAVRLAFGLSLWLTWATWRHSAQL
jgi:hypothetical protein